MARPRWILEPLVPALIALTLLAVDVWLTRDGSFTLVPGSVDAAASTRAAQNRSSLSPPRVASAGSDSLAASPISPGSSSNPAWSPLPVQRVNRAQEGRWEIVIDPNALFDEPLYPGPRSGDRRIAAFPPAWTPDDTELRAWDTTAYRIRAGDLLDLFVWGQDNLSGKLLVGRDGTIVVKLGGSVAVSGLTVDQAGARIAQRLRRYLVSPAVTVSVAEFGGKDVVVVGEVEVPGPLAIDRPTRLLDVLIQTRWKRDVADLSNIKVARGDSTATYDISAVLRGVDLSPNILVEAGDLVIVPNREQAISVLGAVLKPGKYNFSRDRTMRIRDVLIESTLWTPKANIARALILHPDGSMDPVNMNALWFQGDAREDRVVRNGDAIIIPELTEVGVYVLGKVSRAGLYTRSGSFNLLQALSLAGVSTFHARLYDVRVVHGWPGNPVVRRYSVRALLDGDLSQNVELEPGDVIFVPEGVLSYTLQFWNALLSPIGGTASAIESVDAARETLEGDSRR